MKNNLLKYYIAAFYLCSNVVVFAQPGNNDGSGGLEGTDPAAAPIDDYIWVLAAIGLGYVFFRMRHFVQKGSVSKE